jgi:hypothetical protein
MATPATTVYANVVNFRVTPGEFVMEFGAHFPDQPGQAPPSDFRPDVRVVLPAAALQGMIQAMSQAAQQRQQQQPRKPTPGFQGPTGPVGPAGPKDPKGTP